MKKCGFTLIELLVVMAILAILITLGSKGLRNARISAKKAQAMVEIKSIETAIKSYQRKYGKFPAASLVQQGVDDIVFDFANSSTEQDADSEEIITVLTMAEGVSAVDNAASMVFLEPQSDGSTGAFLDPWGYQYLIALDTDYDGQVMIDGVVVRRSVAVASIGLYALKSFANTNDIIKSWQ